MKPSYGFVHSALVYHCEWHTLDCHTWIPKSDDLTPVYGVSDFGVCLLLCIHSSKPERIGVQSVPRMWS